MRLRTRLNLLEAVALIGVASFFGGLRESFRIDRLEKNQVESSKTDLKLLENQGRLLELHVSAIDRMDGHSSALTNHARQIERVAEDMDEVVTNFTRFAEKVHEGFSNWVEWQTNVNALMRERPSIEVHILPPNGLPALPLPPGLNAQEKVL